MELSSLTIMVSDSVEYHCSQYRMFAIRTYLADENGKEQIIGHMPLELFRFTKYLWDLRVTAMVKFTSTHYHRSVPIQEGLEIPRMVEGKIKATEKNASILDQYLVNRITKI